MDQSGIKVPEKVWLGVNDMLVTMKQALE